MVLLIEDLEVKWPISQKTLQVQYPAVPPWVDPGQPWSLWVVDSVAEPGCLAEVPQVHQGPTFCVLAHTHCLREPVAGLEARSYYKLAVGIAAVLAEVRVLEALLVVVVAEVAVVAALDVALVVVVEELAVAVEADVAVAVGAEAAVGGCWTCCCCYC